MSEMRLRAVGESFGYGAEAEAKLAAGERAMQAGMAAATAALMAAAAERGRTSMLIHTRTILLCCVILAAL